MLFIPLRKVDSVRRIVIARLDETPDRSGMVMDYESSKPAFLDWSDSMRKATGGASLGNVREMHTLKAAGKVTRLDCLDVEKAFEFELEIVDDDSMAKVEAGVLTGISQGGKYGRRWQDGSYIRYTAGKVNELSLVDYPCNPTGTFSMVKADGAEVTVSTVEPEGAAMRFVGALLIDAETPLDYREILIAQPADMLKSLFPEGGPDGMQKRDFDAAERQAAVARGEAMPDGAFPIAKPEDIAVVLKAFGHASDKTAAKAWIERRAKELGATSDLPVGWEGSTKKDIMQKGFDQVVSLTTLIQSLRWLTSTVIGEAAAEQDGSKIPDRLVVWVKDGVVILGDMMTEESTEAMAALQASLDALPPAAAAVMESAAKVEDMAKAGARNNKTDQSRIQAIHDHAASLGAHCPEHEGGGLPSMVKIAGELTSMRSRLTDAIAENDVMQKRIRELEGEPAPGGPGRTNVVVDKANDLGGQGSRASEEAAALRAIEAMPDGAEKTTALVRHSMKFN